MIVRREKPLRDDQARQREPPARDADDGRVQADVHVVDLTLDGIVLEARMPRERGQVQPLPRRQIVGDLGLRVAKPEAHRAIGQAVDDEIEIGLAAGYQPRPALMAADGTFGDARRVGAAHGHVERAPLARSVPHPEIDFGAGVAGVALRITAVEKRDVLQHVAVDHRDRAGRPAVLDAANRVEEVRRGEAVHGERQVAEVAAADGELAAEVVPGRDTRQDLHRS